MQTIRFSHHYDKMPTKNQLSQSETILMQVFTCQKSELTQMFLGYDTSYKDKDGNTQHYPIPDGKLLVLVLFTAEFGIWTTIRSWDKEKEKYYRSLQEQEVNIAMEG